MRTYTVQITEIFAIESSKDEVAVFFTVRDKSEWGKPAGEFLKWNYTIWWVSADDFILRVCANHWSMRFAFHEVYDLSVSLENHKTCFNHVLENEIFVIIAHVDHIGQNNIINSHFPLICLIYQVSHIIYLLLIYICIQNLFINSAS